MKNKVIAKIMTGMLVIAMTGTLLGCGQTSDSTAQTAGGQADTQTTTEVTENVSISDKDGENSMSGTTGSTECAGWQLEVEDVQINHDFNNISEELGYTSATTSEVSYEAEDGYNYCMIKLNITKDGSTEEIAWDKMLLTDENGTEYTRVDDNFITELGMKRIQSTNLNFGTYEGWVCYQVPDSAQKFTLHYAFEVENLELIVQ